MKYLLLGLLLCLASALPPAAAQETMRIAAIVNDEVVSMHDLERRIGLIVSTTQLPDTAEIRQGLREQALRSLIDERLQMQEAARLNITVSDAELDQAIAMLEEQNRIPPGRFEEFLHRQGVDRQSVMQQITAELAWSSVIRRRLLPTVEITEEEVESMLAQLRENRSSVEMLVSEIFLTVESPDQEEMVRRTAQQIADQLRAGEASFPAVARQFSQGPTAAAGGDVGWVQPGMLTEEVDAALAGMAQGQLSEPIRTAGGYYILFLRERRQPAVGPEDTTVALKQLLLPLSPNADPQAVAAQTDLAGQLGATISGCDDLDQAAKELGSPESGDLGKLRIRDLPEQFRPTVLELPIGELSPPLRTPNGLHLLMVCERSEAEAGLPSREDVRNGLLNRRISLLARRYMRDLRRDAVVEFR